jgi:YHS domain-containing protein
VYNLILYEAVKHIYPDINDNDFTIYDDGTGQRIIEWKTDLTKPNDDELNAAWVDVELSKAKQNKMDELDAACNKTILGRFAATVDGVVYYFSNDTEAQSNFKDTKLLFEDGTIDALLGGVVRWTAYDENGNVNRIQLNKDQFQNVFISRVKHQNDNVSKLRDDLEPKVDSATIEEISLIQW